MQKKRLVILLLAILIFILPNVFAEFEVYGYVRHHISNDNSSIATLERTSFLRQVRDTNWRTPDKSMFYYSVIDILDFNNQTDIPYLENVDITKITVKCEQWKAEEDFFFPEAESLDMDAWYNATYKVLINEAYTTANTPFSKTEVFNFMSDTLIKCTSKTYYTGVTDLPERLDEIEPISFLFLLPNYDTKICSDWKIQDTVYGRVTAVVLSIIGLNLEFFVTIYWIFKIIVYIGVLCLMVYIVVWFYLFLKGLMGKLD